MAENHLKKWENGERGNVVKEIIEYNFNLLDQKINNRTFSKPFESSDWQNSSIIVPYYDHRFSTPMVQVFMLVDGIYVGVHGAYYVDFEHNVYLQSDIPFAGKVVIR